MKTIRFIAWWWITLLLAAILTWPTVVQAGMSQAPADPLDHRHDRNVCLVDNNSHASVFLHLKIHWWLVMWTTNADVLLSQANALGQTTTTVRDAINQVVQRINPLGRATSFEYDAAGNVITITDPNNQATRFEYYPTWNRVTKITDALNQVTALGYDLANGNLLTVTDPLNHVTTIAYNSFGQPTSVQGPIPSEPPTTFAYDTNGNLITTTDPLGHSTQRVYDAVSRLTALTDPRGLITQFRYDGLNRVTEIADARQGLTHFTYDPNGNLLTVTDAKNQTTAYTYDTMDRLKTRADGLNRTETYAYDPAGNLASFTDRKGQQTTFQYDALNRRIQATYPDATTRFTYDAVGRLIHAADTAPGAGALDFRYDSLDRLIQEITGQGAVAYQYDGLGRRTSLVANGLVPVTYGYDAASRLTQVAQGVLAVGLGYDNANRRTSLTYPNGTSTSYAYDVASRLTNMTHNGPSGLIEGLAYTYDSAGNRTSLARANATASLLPNAVASATYDAANEQIAFAGATLTYDQNGNLTNDGVNMYIWDMRNRLIGLSGGAMASFQYDPIGRRTNKIINSVATQFLYDGVAIIAEIGGGAVGANYLRSLIIDEPLIRQTSEGNEQYHMDALGSSLALSSSQGNSVTAYAYEAFGKTTVIGSSSNSFQFTGRENDFPGLSFYRSRYYSENRGRFLSSDRVGLAGGLNVYAYAANNPVRFSDPWGLWSAEGHNKFLTDRFGGGMDPELLAQVLAGSASVDAPAMQTPRFAPMHAMTSDVFPTEKVARKAMCDFVNNNMNAFRNYLNNNEPAIAYHHLGQALHPVMDTTSPAHRGFQYWRLPHSKAELDEHIAQETLDTITPDLERQTLSLMNATLSGDYSVLGCGK